MRPHTILLAFLVMAASCFGQFYFANAGVNTDSGTIDHPWQTLGKLNTSLQDATQSHEGAVYYFKRGDTFDDAVVLLDIAAGSAIAPIIIRDYGDAALPRPIFRELPAGGDEVFDIAGSDYITLMNLDIVGNADPPAASNGATPVSITLDSDNIEIHNCIIRDNLLAAGGGGVLLGGTNAGIVIANCEIYNCGASGVRTLGVGGTAEATVRDCYIHDIGLQRLGLADYPVAANMGSGVFVHTTSWATIERCRFERCDYAGVASISDSATPTTVDDCVFRDRAGRFAVNVTGVGGEVAATNCVVDVSDGPDGGTGYGFFCDQSTLTAKHCTFINASGQESVRISALSTSEVTVQNCAFFASGGGGHWLMSAANPGLYALWDVDHNAYWPDGAAVFDGGNYAAWLLLDGQDEDGSVNDAASLVGGTLYPEAGRLLATAPAIDAGVNLAVATDFWGYPRITTEGVPVDIGAMTSSGGPYIPYPTGVVLVGREGPDGWTPDDLTDIPLSTATVVGGPNHWAVVEGSLGSMEAWATYTITAGPFASGRPLWSCETAREGGQMTIPALTGPVGQDLYLTISVDHGSTIDKDVPVAGRIKVAVQ